MTARESCDDGNALDGDGCSATCAIEVRVVATDPSGRSDIHVADGRRSIGIDGSGRALVVWVQDENPSARTRLLGRRYSASGASEEGAIELDANLFASPPVATPAVAGLPSGGWVVAWGAFREGTHDIVFRVVGPRGEIGPEYVANTTRANVQRRPSLVVLTTDFVVAWESAFAPPGDPEGGVYARRFDATGQPLGNEIILMSDTTGTQSDVALAADGDRWIAVWTDQRLASDYIPELRLRRFDRSVPTDVAALATFPPKSSDADVIAYASGYLIAYRTAHADPEGDVERIFVPAVGDPEDPQPFAGTLGVAERAPALAAIGEGLYVGVVTTGVKNVELVTNTAASAAWLELTNAMRDATRASLAASPFGLWIVWQSPGLPGGGYGAAAWYWPSR